MKKITSLLLCMVLVLAVFCGNAAATETTCTEAGITVSDDGTVKVTVTAMQYAANARLTVDFDAAYLAFAGYETGFSVHSVKDEAGKLTVGLANASSGAVKPGDVLIELSFRMTGGWDKTTLTVDTANYGGKAVNESVTFDIEGSGYRFQDVQAGQWFFEAVDYMAEKGIIKGVSQTSFGPGQSMNRAAFVTLLGRLDGVAENHVQTPFDDVPVDSFYSGYVAWAVENNITAGISATKFAPVDSINRAQMVAFLYRYARYKGMDVSVEDPEAVLKDYIDGEAVCAIGWAAEPFAWAVQNGVIQGMSGTLNPNGTANRAQVAVMLYRFFFEQ